MPKTFVIPAQIRAGRALLDWSQDQLAAAAGVALSSVRDTENQRRAIDTRVVSAIRLALENAGVKFTPGTEGEGPGVQLVADRPNIIRLPTTKMVWDGLPFTIEWRGKEITVFVTREAIEDLGQHTGTEPDEAYLKTFEKYKGSILDGVKVAIHDPQNFDRYGQLHLRGEYISELIQN